ncbi:hypothetical protein DQG23_29870 [Paenibacillus contaminans]|uniref:Uncharacterized protein n=1 Tax=Paenibacillus contaminans TaxID=450362 RepID=A0A329MEQ6_9BACL|nr:hypothetical protein DQG23_29870 [Paenibacillus contaminans]
MNNARGSPPAGNRYKPDMGIVFGQALGKRYILGLFRPKARIGFCPAKHNESMMPVAREVL